MPGSIKAAFSSTVMSGLLSLLPRIQLSRSVTVSCAELLRGNLIAPLAERALGVLHDVSLVYQGHAGRLCFSANSMAMRTRRLVPVIDIGLMPMPESARIFFLVPGQHHIIEEVDKLLGLGQFPLSTRSRRRHPRCFRGRSRCSCDRGASPAKECPCNTSPAARRRTGRESGGAPHSATGCPRQSAW